MSGIEPENIMAREATLAIAGAWDTTDMESGAGRLVIMMDVNWFTAEATANRRNIIENVQTFLEGGNVRDNDGYGIPDPIGPDDDNDGVVDINDRDHFDHDICVDIDNDTCDDCVIGADDFGPLAGQPAGQ